MSLSVALVLSGWVYASVTAGSKEVNGMGLFVGLIIAITLTAIAIVIR